MAQHGGPEDTTQPSIFTFTNNNATQGEDVRTRGPFLKKKKASWEHLFLGVHLPLSSGSLAQACREQREPLVGDSGNKQEGHVLNSLNQGLKVLGGEP